ncbi:MAG: exo-alpha-sialidase [Acidobacteria bacterium]|nr:exo-alpha-sialidase [Acidobacteriota bacterium]
MRRRDFMAAALASGAESGKPLDLFESGAGGYESYRIPGIVVAPKGSVLAYCEARKSNPNDWGETDILLRRSTDGGRSFAPPANIAHIAGPVAENPAGVAQKLAAPGVLYDNPLAISDRKAHCVHLLFCVEYMRAFHIRSDDDGATWSQPKEITSAFQSFRPGYPWQVIAIGPGHGIQLRNGRLVAAVWLSTGTGSHAHRPSAAATIYSDDHGRTWRNGDIAVPNGPEFVNPSEGALAQLSSGEVMLNLRTEGARARRTVLTSPDGATRWSAPQFQPELPDPVCFGSLLEDPKGKRLLFINPDNFENRQRKNLAVRVSRDNGRTWPEKHVVDPGWAAYSDIAMAPNGDLLCFYERGAAGASRMQYNYLTLTRLRLSK